MSFEDRNTAEAAFFSRGRYLAMPAESMGIATLRARLSQLLYKHLKTELPALRGELNDRHAEVCHELSLMGEKRSTTAEQRRFLMRMGTAYQHTVKSAVDGQYESKFFGKLDTQQAVDHESNTRRLRAVVQYLNLQFAGTMRLYGHRQQIVPSEPIEESGSTHEADDSGIQLDADYAKFAELQERIDRPAAVSKVRSILLRSRGTELPGTFNPLLISQLFWEQSSSWMKIADYHIDRIAAVCSNFVRVALEFTATSDVSFRLQELRIDGVMQEQLQGAKRELQRIIRDTQYHPITYDPAYAAIVSKMRTERYKLKIDSIVEQAKICTSDNQQCLDTHKVRDGFGGLVDPDMDRTSAEDALDCEEVYYGVGILCHSRGLLSY